MAKKIKFRVDAKGSNDGHTVLAFKAGESYQVGDGPDEVGPELVKAFTQDQKVVLAAGAEPVPVAELVEEKGDGAKAKTTAGETPPPKPVKKD